MHTSNLVAAWVLSAHDRLAAAGAATELGQRQAETLTLVGVHPDCSIEWLRSRIGLTQSGTVRLVDRLEDDGLVERRRSGGRAVALRVTGKGRNRLERWRRGRELVVEELLNEMPAEQGASLVAAIESALKARPRARAEADRTCRTCDWPACGGDCPVDHSVASA